MIMVVSMVVLPLFAVIGVKVPEFLRSGGFLTRATAEKPAAQKPLAEGRSLESLPSNDGAPPKDTETKDKNKAESLDYPVVRMGNIDVRPEEPSFVQPAKGLDFEMPKPFVPTGLEEPAGSNDIFLQIQQRLKALGATHYSLETWGTTGESYRFQCRMAAGHDLNYARHFEATDVDPLRVMHTVLEEVESWKAGRLP